MNLLFVTRRLDQHPLDLIKYLRLQGYSVSVVTIPQQGHYDSPISDEQAQSVIAPLCADDAYDGVIVDYQWLLPVFRHVPSSAIKMVFLHDVRTRMLAGFEAQGYRHPHYEWTIDLERELFELADCVIYHSDGDRIYLTSNGIRSQFVRCGFAKTIHPAPHPPVKDQLLYIGSAVGENLLALGWFIEHVWPRILAARPQARLHTIGLTLQHLRHQTIVQHGIVEGSLAEHYFNAAACIVPHLAVGGLKLKTAEALSYGKPIFATDNGLDGFERFETSVFTTLADIPTEPDRFANFLITALSEPEILYSYAKHSQAVAKRALTPEAAYGDLLFYLETR